MRRDRTRPHVPPDRRQYPRRSPLARYLQHDLGNRGEPRPDRSGHDNMRDGVDGGFVADGAAAIARSIRAAGSGIRPTSYSSGWPRSANVDALSGAQFFNADSTSPKSGHNP